MWSKVPKLFWVCFVLIYLNALVWWFFESVNPDLPKTFVAGAPAAFWYACIFSCLIVNVFVAWLLSKV